MRAAAFPVEFGEAIDCIVLLHAVMPSTEASKSPTTMAYPGVGTL